MLTSSQSIYLAASAEFNKLLAEDEQLKKLEAERFNPAEELQLIMEFLPGTRYIGTVPIHPLTPAIWSLLWVFGNNYATGDESPTGAETNEFLYLLSNGLKNLSHSQTELTNLSSGFCQRHGLDPILAKFKLLSLIRNAFKPLEMLPAASCKSDSKPMYDLDWLSGIVSVAARMSNERASYVIYEMSLSSCISYYIHERRKWDTKNLIRRRLPMEIGKEIYEYTQLLGERFCREKGVR